MASPDNVSKIGTKAINCPNCGALMITTVYEQSAIKFDNEEVHVQFEMGICERCGQTHKLP